MTNAKTIQAAPPDTMQDLALEELLNFRVQRLASKMTLVTTREVLKGTGVNIGEWRVIARLMQDGPNKMTALSRVIGLDAGRTSKLLSAMERKGYVRRESDPNDGRASVFFLTDKSKESYKQIWPKAAETAMGFHALYTDEEHTALNALLDRAIAYANSRLS